MNMNLGPICFVCKRQAWRHATDCPLGARIRFKEIVSPKLSDNVFGPTPPNVFVGHYGYPNVFVGPLVLAESEGVNAELVDSPRDWFGLAYGDIVSFRSSLARGKRVQSVRESTRFSEDLQAAVLSIKPVDLEVRFRRPLSFGVSFSATSAPMGPTGEVVKMDVAGNPSVPAKIDSIIGESLKVRDALPELVPRFDSYYVQKLLSAGVLGKEKKLVPTRWSITASDKMLADYYLQSVRESPSVNDVLLFSSSFLYNHYEILLLPGRWEFEQFEAWAPSSYWAAPEVKEAAIAVEFEPFEGRSDYAESEGGGYYAGRFAVAKALAERGRQARVIIFREIGEEYKVPIGVWAVREAVAKALEKTPQKFSSLNDAMGVLRTRLRNPLEKYTSLSTVLRQKKLMDF